MFLWRGFQIIDECSPKRRLVVIDDLMAETDSRVTQLFTKGSHHRDMSVIQIVQNIFGKNKEQRTISLNAHYIIIFKNPRDKTQIIHLGKQMFPGQSKFVAEAFKSSTEDGVDITDTSPPTGDVVTRCCV